MRITLYTGARLNQYSRQRSVFPIDNLTNIKPHKAISRMQGMMLLALCNYLVDDISVKVDCASMAQPRD